MAPNCVKAQRGSKLPLARFNTIWYYSLREFRPLRLYSHVQPSTAIRIPENLTPTQKNVRIHLFSFFKCVFSSFCRVGHFHPFPASWPPVAAYTTHIHAYTLIYVHMRTYTRIYAQIHAYTRRYAHIHAYVRTYTHIRTHTRIYTRTQVYAHEDIKKKHAYIH